MTHPVSQADRDYLISRGWRVDQWHADDYMCWRDPKARLSLYTEQDALDVQRRRDALPR
jgi:hypothetical protein